MMASLTPLMLAAVTPFTQTQTPARAERIMTASVEIVRSEVIGAVPSERSKRNTDRQYRLRGTGPIVEFF
jgi:hypothetical protein